MLRRLVLAHAAGELLPQQAGLYPAAIDAEPDTACVAARAAWHRSVARQRRDAALVTPDLAGRLKDLFDPRHLPSDARTLPPRDARVA